VDENAKYLFLYRHLLIIADEETNQCIHLPVLKCGWMLTLFSVSEELTTQQNWLLDALIFLWCLCFHQNF